MGKSFAMWTTGWIDLTILKNIPLSSSYVGTVLGGFIPVQTLYISANCSISRYSSACWPEFLPFRSPSTIPTATFNWLRSLISFLSDDCLGSKEAFSILLNVAILNLALESLRRWHSVTYFNITCTFVNLDVSFLIWSTLFSFRKYSLCSLNVPHISGVTIGRYIS